MSTFTISYRINTGAVQSFRCLADSAETAARYWAEERGLVAKVTGGAVTPIQVEVA